MFDRTRCTVEELRDERRRCFDNNKYRRVASCDEEAIHRGMALPAPEDYDRVTRHLEKIQQALPSVEGNGEKMVSEMLALQSRREAVLAAKLQHAETAREVRRGAPAKIAAS